MLPMAITYGMSVKEFWEDSPDLFWAYRFSFFERIKSMQEINNYNSWLQGAYICEAMQVAINNCFNKQKIEYSKKPYGLIGEENVDVNKKEQDLLAIKIKNRVLQVQAIKGKDKSSTTKN
ncbi:MAG: hypothetical protein E7174_02110 [Firmicutes bacterium]|nr:hypothetical protein [Bacillota bacterium]